MDFVYHIAVAILTVLLVTALSVDANQSRNVCAEKLDGTLVGDEAFCWQYFICYNGEAVSRRCDQGNYFDRSSSSCLTDKSRRCLQSECSEEGAYSPHLNDLTLFYVCKNGILEEQSCGAGSYFDQTDLHCLLDTENKLKKSECYENGGYSPHPFNSSLFYVCNDSKLVEKSCGDGKYFDKEYLKCFSNTDSSPQPKQQCHPEGGFSPHPSVLSLFYVCNEGKLVEQSCGIGSYFDKTDLHCHVNPSSLSEQLKCTTDGVYSPHPSACSMFYICIAGKLVKHTCEIGNYFHKTSLQCLPDTDAHCSADPQQCSEVGQASPHPTECALYYTCYDGHLVEQTCGNGSYFSKSNLNCLTDIDNICWNTSRSLEPESTCAGDYKDGEFFASPNNFSSYYVCNNNELVERNCGYGNYFDNDIKKCVEDEQGMYWSIPLIDSTTYTCVGGYEDGELIANPNTCYFYYICSEGELVEESCGYGNYFDTESNKCAEDTTGKCWPLPSTTSGPCTCVGGYADGELVANPDSFYLYYICSDCELVEQSCGYKNYFDNSSRRCVEDELGKYWIIISTTAGPNLCVGGYEDGAFLGNPQSCYMYYICSEGDLVEQNCGYGNYFDSISKRCVEDTAGECWPLPTTTPGPCTCVGGYAEGELLPSPDSFYIYYICSDCELVEQSCGYHNYFDSETKKCVEDENNKYWKTISTTPEPVTCVGGYDNGEFFASPDSCYMYYICNEGDLVLESCGFGNYFDTEANRCEDDTSGICWPLPSTSPKPCTCIGGYADGVLIEAESCYSYFVCSDCELVELNCGYGNYFNSSTKKCEEDQLGVCWPVLTTTLGPLTCVGGYTDGEFLPSPDSCFSYYVCNEGDLVLDSCGYGNYFDNSTKKCMEDISGECWPLPSTTPEPCVCIGGYADGEFIENLDRCYSYYVCSECQLVEQNCGYGNFFDKINKRCAEDSTGECWPIVTTTLSPLTCVGGYAEGDMLLSPDSCYSFYICSEGDLVEQNCGSGNYFDNSTKKCEEDTLGRCWPLLSTITTPLTCIGGYADGELLPSPYTCYEYFICLEGDLLEQSCGYGNYFDSETKRCAIDATGECWPIITTTEAPITCVGGYADGEFLASPNRCYMYYICSEGELVERNCGYGNYFENDSKRCETDISGECWPLPSTTPEPCTCVGGYATGEMMPSLESCYSYFLCDECELVEISCGFGNYFDGLARRCVVDTIGECWPIITTTEPAFTCVGGYSDGEMLESPNGCYMYYLCSEGDLVEQNCGYGNYFQNNTKRCEKDTTGDCWPLPSTSPEPLTCVGGYSNGEMLPSPDSCYMYFICNEGDLVEESCGTSNYFNTKTKRCAFDSTGDCWPTVTTTQSPCVGGYADGDFLANPDSCYTYYICSEGELVEQNCGYGNYFDNTTKRCLEDIAGVCWALSSTTSAPWTCVGGYADGEFLPSPDSCYSYYICNEGDLVEQSCGYRNYFDTGTKRCAKDTKGKCWPIVTTTQTPWTCVGGYADGEFLPSPDSCYSYYICSEGELVEQNCGSGNYFDKTTNRCAFDNTGVCWTLPSTTPTPLTCVGGYADGEFLPSPDSCYSFYICNEGDLVEQSCGFGNYFDYDNKRCALDTTGICWPIETTTKAPWTCVGGYADGEFLPSPDSCYSYFICNEGNLVELSCGHRNYFNTTTNRCSADTTGVCWPLPSTTPAPWTCVGDYADGEFLPSPDNCYSYYICNEGNLVELNCGFGNYFDSVTKRCAEDITGECWHKVTTTHAPWTCVGGYADGEFLASPDSCYSYYICTVGELIEMSCGFGNYFDNTTKRCTSDISGICWPLTSTTPAPWTCVGGYVDGEFLSSPDSCYRYYICTEGDLIEQSCGTGNLFDNTTKKCSVDRTGECWPIQTTTIAPWTCIGGYEEGDILADPDICYSFYICNEGNLVERTCGYGNYFNSSTNRCAEDTTGECWPLPSTTPEPCRCVGGYEEGEFVANPESFYTFFVCTNGELVQLNCGYGNFFDSRKKKCEVDLSGDYWSVITTTPEPLICVGGYENGEFVANPDVCYLFFICIQGELVEDSCGYGNYFDNNTLRCQEDISGECWPLPSTTPEPCRCVGGYEEGDLVASPDSCFSYYICSEGNLVEQSCGYGNYFNNVTSKCTADSTGECWPIISTTLLPCTCVGGYEEGAIISNPDVCYSFLVCTEGDLVEENCGYGNYFNKSSNRCAVDTTGECWPLHTSEAPCTCIGGFEEGEIVASPESCYSYLICSEGDLVEQNCGYGNYFDNSSKRCAADTTGKCWPLQPCTCIGGYNEGDIIASLDSCYSFLICSEGELVEQNCGYGNYFNNSSKKCAADTNGECWPIQTTEASCTCIGGYEEGDIIASPDSCYSFLVCSQGNLVEQNCGYGNYFDNSSKRCAADKNGDCWPIQTTEAPCTCIGGYKEGDIIASPDSCYSFLVCSQGNLVEQNCGYGNYFDNRSKKCVADATSECWPLLPCTCIGGYGEGDIIASPDSCYSFFVCSKGELLEQNCGLGNYFDNSSKKCEADTTGVCWMLPSPDPEPCRCVGGFQDGDIIFSPNNCYSYYVCSRGELVEQNCGQGNYFDNSTKMCERDSEGICWHIETTTTEVTSSCGCPGGFNEGALVANQERCSAYFICTQGQLIPLSCGTGNYFDDESKACMVDKDGICWPTTTSTTMITSAPVPCSCSGGYNNGDLVENIQNCSSYFICTQGELIEQSCEIGNYFDVASKKCVLDVYATCWIIIQRTTIKPMPLLCPGGLKEGDLIPKTDSCFSFYVCSNGALKATNCQPEHYFDQTSNSCVRDTGGTCLRTTKPPLLCPGGYNDGEFIPNNKSCSGYSVCQQGQLMIRSCGRGKYFEASTKSCVLDIDEYCWPTSKTKR